MLSSLLREDDGSCVASPPRGDPLLLSLSGYRFLGEGTRGQVLLPTSHCGVLLSQAIENCGRTVCVHLSGCRQVLLVSHELHAPVHLASRLAVPVKVEQASEAHTWYVVHQNA